MTQGLILTERLCCLRHPFLARHLLRWVGLSWLRFPLQYRPCLRGHRLGLHRQEFCPIVFRRKNLASGRFWGRGYCSKGHLSTQKKAVHFVHSARKFAGAMPSWDWMHEVDWQMLGGVCAGNSGEVPLPLVIAQVIRRDVSLEKRVISPRRHGTHRNRKW